MQPGLFDLDRRHQNLLVEIPLSHRVGGPIKGWKILTKIFKKIFTFNTLDTLAMIQLLYLG